MPPQQTQDQAPHPSDGMSLDEIAATLGFVSMLGTNHLQMSQGIHPTQAAEQPQGAPPQEAQPSEPTPPPEKPAQVSTKKPNKKHEEEQDKEIADIRAELEQLLADENKDGQTTESTTPTPTAG